MNRDAAETKRKEHRPQWPKLTVQDCRERIQKDPEDLDARLVLGMTYRLQGDPRAALELWKSILEFDPSNVPAKQLIRSLELERMRINGHSE